MKKDGKENWKVWTTVLVMVFLEEKMNESKRVWELVVEKAKAWLDRDGNAKWKDLEVQARELVK